MSANEKAPRLLAQAEGQRDQLSGGSVRTVAQPGADAQPCRAGARAFQDRPRRPLDYRATPGDVAWLWASARYTELVGDQSDPPEYGSAAWNALPADHPGRAAAVIAAADQWRQHQLQQRRRDWLLDNDPGRWFRLAVEEADAYASRRCGVLAAELTNDELAARRTMRPPKTLRAAPGWPPVAIPGSRGQWRHHINGRQVDLPHDRQGAVA